MTAGDHVEHAAENESEGSEKFRDGWLMGSAGLELQGVIPASLLNGRASKALPKEGRKGRMPGSKSCAK